MRLWFRVYSDRGMWCRLWGYGAVVPSNNDANARLDDEDARLRVGVGVGVWPGVTLGERDFSIILQQLFVGFTVAECGARGERARGRPARSGVVVRVLVVADAGAGGGVAV